MATSKNKSGRVGDPPNMYPLGHPRNPRTAAQAGPVERRVPTVDPRSVPRGAKAPEAPVEEKAPEPGTENATTSGGEAATATASSASSPSPVPAPVTPASSTDAAPAAQTAKD